MFFFLFDLAVLLSTLLLICFDFVLRPFSRSCSCSRTYICGLLLLSACSNIHELVHVHAHEHTSAVCSPLAQIFTNSTCFYSARLPRDFMISFTRLVLVIFSLFSLSLSD
ncbi:hypothetical protein EV361DRAFT_124260 [Lentinula raphanica]|nr:hypothetical protein EV361DRAFT_124260 [Lentinula raphanica]